MRHALGVLGVLAAGVLLAVSAVMNWRFGYTLGVSEIDKQVYGAASAAADCFKALVPFFLFAAIKNKMWSQALASAVIWVVVTAYSLTSALGHAALSRTFTNSERTVAAASYKDLRSDLKRAQDQLSWVPQHRPASTVLSEIDGLRFEKMWTVTKGCTNVTGPQGRAHCQSFQTLSAELASAQQGEKLNGTIKEINAKLADVSGSSAMTEADPQAAVLAKLAGILGFSVKTEDMQTALAVFVALLLEIGSGFGMYVAFATWRLNHSLTYAPKKVVPRRERVVEEAVVQSTPVVEETAETVEDEKIAHVAVAAVASSPRLGVANDNRSAPKLTAPETDVERFYKERVEAAENDDDLITASDVYGDYLEWCEGQFKEPLAMPSFGRELATVGVRKHRIGGRIKYQGIRLKSGISREGDKKSPVPIAA